MQVSWTIFILGPKLFSNPIFFGPKLFWIPNFILKQILFNPKFLRPKFFEPKTFWTHNFLDTKFLYTHFFFLLIRLIFHDSTNKTNQFSWVLTQLKLIQYCLQYCVSLYPLMISFFQNYCTVELWCPPTAAVLGFCQTSCYQQILKSAALWMLFLIKLMKINLPLL